MRGITLSMKKIFLIQVFFLFCMIVKAQTVSYQKLKDLLQLYHPEINTENKLIAYTLWLPEDKESRELLKQFEKVYGFYEFAKLKGGSKGLIVLAFDQSNSESNTRISFHKDGILKTIPFNSDLLDANVSALKNAVFDANGNMILKNLDKAQVIESIHQRISR